MAMEHSMECGRWRDGGRRIAIGGWRLKDGDGGIATNLIK